MEALGVMKEPLGDDKRIPDFKEKERKKRKEDTNKVEDGLFFCFRVGEEMKSERENDKKGSRMKVNNDTGEETKKKKGKFVFEWAEVGKSEEKEKKRYVSETITRMSGSGEEERRETDDGGGKKRRKKSVTRRNDEEEERKRERKEESVEKKDRGNGKVSEKEERSEEIVVEGAGVVAET